MGLAPLVRGAGGKKIAEASHTRSIQASGWATGIRSDTQSRMAAASPVLSDYRLKTLDIIGRGARFGRQHAKANGLNLSEDRNVAPTLPAAQWCFQWPRRKATTNQGPPQSASLINERAPGAWGPGPQGLAPKQISWKSWEGPHGNAATTSYPFLCVFKKERKRVFTLS